MRRARHSSRGWRSTADGHLHSSRLPRLARGRRQRLRTRHRMGLLSPTRAQSLSPVRSHSKRASTYRRTQTRQPLGQPPVVAERSCRSASWNKISSACRPRRLRPLTPLFPAPAPQRHRIRARNSGLRNSRARALVQPDILLSQLLPPPHPPRPSPRAPHSRASSNRLQSRCNNPLPPTSHTWQTIRRSPSTISSNSSSNNNNPRRTVTQP